MQKLRTMAAATTKARVLVIMPWTKSLATIRTALNDAGCSSRIMRVDIEPALNAALSRGNFDLILLDPATHEVPLDVVEARLREHRRCIPIVNLESTENLVDAIKEALLAHLN